MPRPATWILGLIGLAALIAACVATSALRIEADLSARLARVLVRTGAQASVSGRDVTLTGAVPTPLERVRAVEAAGRVRGVRVVHDEMAVDAPASRRPAPAVAIPDSASASSDSTAAAGSPGADQVAPSGDARVREAEAALREALAAGQVQFESGTARLTSASRDVLDRAADVFTRFPAVGADITGHTDDDGSSRTNRRLSIRRAESTRDYLATKGVAPERLKPRGAGETEPIASNATEAGRARNRRVVFSLRPL